ncbi:MAG: putative membrane protein YqgA involved in biofilm formation [Polaribacter sp.]|jgi:uncharacterized membrane protein YqgA involved in biofilm formation
MSKTNKLPIPIGTFINMASILVGSLIGLMLREVFPEDIKAITFQAVGLGILIIGIKMALKLNDERMVVFIFSLIIGAIIGQWLDIKALLESIADWSFANIHIGQQRFTDGLIAAFILFCASPITMVGAIEEGLKQERGLLIIKSALDGVTAIALASTYGGFGITVSIIPMLFIQGGITMLASRSKSTFTKPVIAQISAVGGVLLIALAIKILNLGDFKVANLLPALVVVVLLTYGYSKMKFKL